MFRNHSFSGGGEGYRLAITLAITLAEIDGFWQFLAVFCGTSIFCVL
jgi:hypothetical protein